MTPQPQSDSRLQAGAAGVIHDTNYLESFCDEDFPSIGKVQKQKDCASKDHVYPGVYENVYYRHSNTSSHTRKFLLSIIVVIHILVLCVVAFGIWIKYSHSNAASELLNAEETATSWNQVEQPYTSHGSHLISDSTETSGDTTASRNREQPVSNKHQSPTHAYWSLLERAFNIQRTFLIQLSKLKNYMEPDDIEQLITQYKTSELQNEAMDLSIFVYELVALWGGVPMDEMMTFGNYVCAEGVLAMKVGLITDNLSDPLYSHPDRQLTQESFMTTVEKVLTSTNELQRSVFEKVLEVANSLKDADFNWWARENMHRMDLSKQIDSKIELILSHVIFGNESIFKKGDLVDFVHHTRDLQRNLRDQLMLLKLSFNKRINSIQTNPTQIPSNAGETPSEDVPGTGAAYVTSASLIQALYSDVLQGVTRELTMFVRLLRSSPLHAGTLQKVLSSYEQSIAQRFQGFTTFMTKVVLVHAGLSFVELEEFRDLARDVDSRCKQELATSVGDSNPLEGIPSAQEYMKEFLRLVKDESKMERAFVRGLRILKSRLPEDSASGMSNTYMEFIQNNTFHQQIFFLKQQIIAQWPGLTSYQRLNIERDMSAIELYNKTLFTYLFSWLNSAPHA